jgi:threonine dehydrogenase-like Zn-dependent dehydrogenase
MHASGSDLHEYESGPQMIKGETFMGHEFSGVVHEVGSDVQSRFRVGQNVCVRPAIGCGSCRLCQAGHSHVCKQVLFYGGSQWPAGLSQYASIPASHIYVLPENVPLDVGALVEPLSVAWHAVKMSEIKPGQVAVGESLAQAAHLRSSMAFHVVMGGGPSRRVPVYDPR